MFGDGFEGYLKFVMEEMLQLNGQKSIIIVSGANMRGWSERMINDELQIVRNAGVVQIQREISDSINIQDAKVCIKFVILLIHVTQRTQLQV